MMTVSNGAGKKKSLTIAEVAKHNKLGDCWTVIDGSVYDITDWVPDHPGGDLIRLAFGRDSTTLIESYHSSAAAKKLQATLKLRAKYLGQLTPTEPLPDKAFFLEVRNRVESYLEKHHLPRQYFEWVSLTEVLVTSLLFVLCSYWKIATGSYFAAAWVGILTGRIGFMMHMGNHAAISKRMFWNQFASRTMDLIGASHFNWRFEHQVAHHMDPNDHGKDNDCEIGEPILRFHPMLPRYWYHCIQHVMMVILMTGGLAKWCIGDCFNILHERITNVSFSVNKWDFFFFFLWKAQFVFLHIFLPIYLHGFTVFAIGFAIHLAIGAHYIENIFIVNHIQDGLVPYSNAHWAAKQVIATSNWSSGSLFWNFFSGGLNHQIEHHLFPSVSHYLYPALSPIVRQCCKDFNLPYHNFPSYAHAWWAMFTYLRALGTAKYDAFIKRSKSQPLTASVEAFRAVSQ